jgi:hypothetical protein
MNNAISVASISQEKQHDGKQRQTKKHRWKTIEELDDDLVARRRPDHADCGSKK